VEKNTYRRAFCFIYLTKYYSGDQIKKNGMGWACGNVAYIGERRSAYWVWWGTLKGKGHLEDPGVDVRIILRWIFRKWDMGGGYGLERAESG